VRTDSLTAERLQHSLPAAGHVVDEGTIDVGAADADRIKERFKVSDEILLIRKLFTHNLGITGLAEHHQASRNSYCFSPGTPSHSSYTDPF
jgi:hypothetical protein